MANCTLVLETNGNSYFTATKLKEIRSGEKPFPGKIVVVCHPGKKAKVLAELTAHLQGIEVVEVLSLRHDLAPILSTPFLAYLPSSAPYCPIPPEIMENLGNSWPSLWPWIPPVSLDENEWARLIYMSYGWVAHTQLLEQVGQAGSLTFRDWERVVRTKGINVPYLSAPAGPGNPKFKKASIAPLNSRSRVLALVPHYQCDEWLEQCLDSLVRQTRPPEAIAVLDDASPTPPIDIINKFPGVTLLGAPGNVGLFRLIQSAIEQTTYDAYMLQDADDWSALDRLELQLEEAEKTGAEWIGVQELMYFDDMIHAARYPLVLNPAFGDALRTSFCHPSGLVSRDLVMRLGGYSGGLRFSGDLEFLSRAVWEGKVANLDRYAYFRRIRKNSLITSPATGLGSQARQELDIKIKNRMLENRERTAKGQTALLAPLVPAPLVTFDHLAGPRLLH
ncbi:MAG TPA: glycosyltransferase family 2 protein [bacterium]|nr:glycosyltransferase family 2 protein [bacterium]